MRQWLRNLLRGSGFPRPVTRLKANFAWQPLPNSPAQTMAKAEAWLIFYGSGLPTPKNVKKITLTLQQDDEPAQTVQVFNYRFERKIGAIAFAVPGLTALLDGMRDKQSFKLSIDGETAMTLQWTDAAPVIQQLKQCAQ